MITIKVKIKYAKHEKIAHVKNAKDCATWLSLLHGDFERVTIRDHSGTKEVIIESKLELNGWIESNK